VQVTSVARSIDIQLQPHHMFAVMSLQLEAMHAAKSIAKPGLCSLSIVLLLVLTEYCWPIFVRPIGWFRCGITRSMGQRRGSGQNWEVSTVHFLIYTFSTLNYLISGLIC